MIVKNKATISIIFCLIVVIYASIELFFLSGSDFTVDEGAHFRYGIRILKGEGYKASCTYDDSKMPISALNALPRGVLQVLYPNLKKTDMGVSDIRMGRYVTFLFSLLTLFIVFKWSSGLYGYAAGLFSTTLTAFCPVFLSLSGLVTSDAYSACIYLLVLYTLWKYLSDKSWKYFLAFCIFTGIAQITKQTFFHLYLCLPLIIIIYTLVNRQPIKFTAAVKKSLVFIIINLLVINAAFLFYKTGQPLNEYTFVSRLFTNFQKSFSFIGSIPLPLPEAFLIGMDSVKYYDELGGGFPDSSFGVVSILGSHDPGKSYWFYYLATIFFKLPIPALIFFIITIVLILKHTNRTFFIKNELIIVVAMIYFLIVLSFFNNIQAGIRHILFLFPSSYILCGKITLHLKSITAKTGLIAGLTWLLISVFSYFNNYFPYTNEFILDKKNAYKKVGAANLDYGQGYTAAWSYINNHPNVRMAEKMESNGKFLISVGDYEDKFGLHTYNWLKKYPVIGHVHHAFLLIETK